MITEEISKAYVQAVKDKDTFKRDTLKLVKSAFTTLEKAGKQPNQADYVNVVSKMVKVLRENADLYPAMKEDNLKEAEIISQFLPQQLNEIQVRELIQQVSEQNSLPYEKKSMGQLVKLTVTASNGRTDGKIVSTIVNELIQNGS